MMHESYKPLVKYFHRWMPQVCLLALVVFTNCASGFQGDYTDGLVDDFKTRVRQKLDELKYIKTSALESDRAYVPLVLVRPRELYDQSAVAGCVVNSDLVFTVSPENHVCLIRNSSVEQVTSIPRDIRFVSLQGFQHEDDICLLSYHTDKSNTHFLKMYKYRHNGLEFDDLRTPLSGPSLVSTLMYGNKVHTFVVPTHSVSPEITLFSWLGTHFDEDYSSGIDDNASALETWHVDGTVYAAFSYASKNKTVVQRYIEKYKNMSTVQTLNTGAISIKYFEDTGHRYLLFGTGSHVKIYKWSGFSFRLEKRTDFPKPVQVVDVHKIGRRSLIAVVLSNEVHFMAQGYWPTYVKAVNTISFESPVLLKSVLLWHNGASHLMLPVTVSPHSPVMYELSLRFQATVLEKQTIIGDCLERLYKDVDSRNKVIDFISANTNKFWTPDSRLKSANLKVNGSIKSPTKVTIRRVELQAQSPSMADVQNLQRRLANITDEQRRKVANLLLKSQRQILRGDFVFEKMHIKRGMMAHLQTHTKLNNVSTSRLPFCLRKKGNQLLSSKYSAANMKSTQVDIATLNGIEMEDFVLLNNSNQVLNGTYVFSAASAQNLYIKSNAINGINIDSFVLRSKPQNITGRKIFFKVKASRIQTDGNVNQIDLKIVPNLVLLSAVNVSSNLYFASKIVVLGDLKVKTMNGRDITRLWKESVHRTSKQKISGQTFKSVTVGGDLVIKDLINKMDTRNLLTRHTDQTLYGNVGFFRTTGFQAIETDSINGHDLSAEVVRKNENGWIGGRKTFTRTLNVADITLKDGVLLDGFDPSVEASMIVTKNVKNETLLLNGMLTVGNVHVKNNLHVTEDSQDVPILEILRNVWLKNTEQNISSLVVKKLSLNEVEVSRVNNISVDNLVPVDGDVTIHSVKRFLNDTRVGSMNVAEGKFVNITDLWRPGITIKVGGNIILDTMIIEKDLTVSGSINGAEDFLQAENFQTIRNELEFETVRLEDLIASELDAPYVNRINLTRFFEDAVVRFNGPLILSNNFTSVASESLVCDGFLNGVLLSQVATKNTMQRFISPLIFFDAPLHFLNQLGVEVFFGTIRLQDVVLVDVPRTVSNKFFNGPVKTPHLTVSGLVNGINITDLDTHAFYKDRSNTVQVKMSIESNVTVEDIQVCSNSTVDGVKLSDFILLNETANLKSLNIAGFSAENLNVTGLINECNLTSVLQNSLYLKADAQNLTKRTYIQTLVIVGDLKLEQLNAVWLSDLISFLEFTSSADIDRDVIFEMVELGEAHFRSYLNECYLESLLVDTVRKSFEQNISSPKFFNDVSTKNITVQQLQALTACGVNIRELFGDAIKRLNVEQTIMVDNLASLSAKSVTLDGRLNNLTLPDDTVLVNKSELITTPVVVNSTMNVTSGLEVHGKLGGVNFTKFLPERMTLSSAENASAELIFLDNVFINGSTTVHGSINRIKLEDVVNRMEPAKIKDNVVFVHSLTVKSDARLYGLANGVHLEDLESNIVKTHQNESLKELVAFLTMNTSELTCQEINAIDVKDFFNYRHFLDHRINEALDNYTDRILDQAEKLRSQKDSEEQMLSLFSYFELQETLNLESRSGLPERFLPIYESGVLGEKYELHVIQMVIWLKISHQGCRRTRSLIADVSENGSLKVVKKKNGRIFPLSLRSQWKNVVGFIVQAEHPRKCFNKTKTIVLETMLVSGSKVVNKIQFPANAVLEEARLLELHEIFLLLAISRDGPGERMFLYRYDTTNDVWEFHQSFHDQPFSSLDWTSVETPGNIFLLPDFYLAISGRDSNPGVTVYEWDFDDDELFMKTNFTTSASSHVLWVITDHMQFLLLAKEMSTVGENGTLVNRYNEPLTVYSLGEDGMALNHEVNLRGVRHLEMFVISGEIFILASSPRKETLYVLQYRGYSGFEVIQKILAPGITRTILYTVETNLFLAIISSTTGHSRVLKAVIRGGRQGLF